jgi:WhiB family redox-sensing transcriptional regulator
MAFLSAQIHLSHGSACCARRLHALTLRILRIFPVRAARASRLSSVLSTFVGSASRASSVATLAGVRSDPDPIVLALMAPGDIKILDVFNRPAWQSYAACRGQGADEWFPGRGASTAAAKAVCERCPVQSYCLAYALEWPELKGVWGGLSEQQRERLRARRSA